LWGLRRGWRRLERVCGLGWRSRRAWKWQVLLLRRREEGSSLFVWVW
jgi:hypothetical protein